MLTIEATPVYRRGRKKDAARPLAGYMASLVGDGNDGDALGVVERDDQIFGNATAALDCLSRGIHVWGAQVDLESMRADLTEAAAVSAAALTSARVANILKGAGDGDD